MQQKYKLKQKCFPKILLNFNPRHFGSKSSNGEFVLYSLIKYQKSNVN